MTRLARRLRQEAQAGASPSQLAALATIEAHQPLSLGDLAAHERVQPPTITAVVSALVGAGLVTREPDREDRRVSWLRLTPAGARFLERARRRKDSFLATRLRSLEPERLATLEAAAAFLQELVEEPR